MYQTWQVSTLVWVVIRLCMMFPRMQKHPSVDNPDRRKLYPKDKTPSRDCIQQARQNIPFAKAIR
jgi:hypothetical protein